MIAGLKPYQEYKESGSRWLATVPVHWEVRNLRTLIRPRAERNRADLPLLSVAREKGVFVRSSSDVDENHNVVPEDLSNYKVARAGDLVINKMKAWQGSMGIAPCDGIVSPAYFVFDFGIGNSAFGQYLLRSKPYVAHFGQASDGVRIGQWDLTVAAMRQIPVLVPPPEEQSAIAWFLDYADRRIRRYIGVKQKLVKLLVEQKQAIIHRAVTRGLDPNVRLKPSGVEWLGAVPEHWQVRSFTRFAIERADYRGATPTKTESGVFLVTARNVRKGRIDYEVSKEFVAEAEYATIMRRGLPRLGDLLLTMEAPLGHAALVDREDVAFAQRVMRFRFDLARLVPEFVLCSVLSPYFQNQLLRRGTGSTALGIKASKLPQLQLLCPPVVEQKEIIEHIRVECSPIDAVADRAQREISLFSEYRTRLIADVVTGKLDVRAAAASLPDDVDEPESLADADALEEGDDVGDGDIDTTSEDAEM